MKKILYALCLTLCLTGVFMIQVTPVWAEEETSGHEETINEDELFSDSETITKEEDIVKEDVGAELTRKKIGFSGDIRTSTTYNGYDSSKDWTKELLKDEPVELENIMSANFLVDIRLQKGIKGFLNAGIDYTPAVMDPETTTVKKDITNYQINEFFLDTNVNNKIYFRTGKQVLKWGTGYFWNPTDLINIDRKTFLDMDKVTEGTFGEKIQIPFGVKRNIYFFIGGNEAAKVSDISLAGKYEWLIGETEMSISAWGKGEHKPVYGYDFTSRVGDVSIRGEVSVAPGDNPEQLILDYDTLKQTAGDEWVPQASLGFTKSFDNGNYKDRISLTGEFYYNGNGYEKNIFSRIAQIDNEENRKSIKAEYIGKYYKPYMNSKYYFAFFTSVYKFIKPELTLNINGITNLVDDSSSLTTGLSYTPALTDLTLECSITGFIGDENTEATYSGKGYLLTLKSQILF